MNKQTLNEQIKNMEVSTPEEVKKLFSFVEISQYEQDSLWHGNTVIFTEYGFKANDGQYFWFNRRTSSEDKFYDYDDILVILNTLVDSNFKYVCYHCGKGCLGSANSFINPVEFAQYVKENKFTYNKLFAPTIYAIKRNHWRFSGNLNEISSSFQFDIFDEDLKKQLEEITGLKEV